MDRSKKIIISVLASLSISAVSLTYAAEKTTNFAPAPSPAAVTSPKINITQEKAVEIALKAYSGSKLINAKLYDTVYIVRVSTATEKHYLKVGALSGRILQDSLINAQGKIESSTVPVTTVAPVATPGTKGTTTPVQTPVQTPAPVKK